MRNKSKWFELIFQGVSHFAIYVSGVHPKILKFFEEVSTKLPAIQIDLLPWNLWMFWDEIHDNAGMARYVVWVYMSLTECKTRTQSSVLCCSINDCMYRYMGQTEYLLVADLDEFMIPSYATKYSRLLPELQRIYNRGMLNSFIFQNRFYCLERNRRSPMIDKHELNILIRLNGVKEFWWPYGLRNKVIVFFYLHIDCQSHWLIISNFILLSNWEKELKLRVGDEQQIPISRKEIRSIAS